jgi:hypothetical protein
MRWLSTLLAPFKRGPERLMPERRFVVAYDDQQVTLSHPERATEAVAWSDLQEVEIITTDDGPWSCDWYWALHGSTSGIAVPRGATGEMDLLKRLQKLPGFSNEAVLQAGGHTDNHRVSCWKKNQ